MAPVRSSAPHIQPAATKIYSSESFRALPSLSSFRGIIGRLLSFRRPPLLRGILWRFFSVESYRNVGPSREAPSQLVASPLIAHRAAVSGHCGKVAMDASGWSESFAAFKVRSPSRPTRRQIRPPEMRLVSGCIFLSWSLDSPTPSIHRGGRSARGLFSASGPPLFPSHRRCARTALLRSTSEKAGCTRRGLLVLNGGPLFLPHSP